MPRVNSHSNPSSTGESSAAKILSIKLVEFRPSAFQCSDFEFTFEKSVKRDDTSERVISAAEAFFSPGGTFSDI